MFRSSREDWGFQFLINGFLLIVLILILIPLWRVIMTSLTPLDVYMRGGTPMLQMPWEWSFAAYDQMLTHPSFPRATLNSIIITVCGTALSLFLCAARVRALLAHIARAQNHHRVDPVHVSVSRRFDSNVLARR